MKIKAKHILLSAAGLLLAALGVSAARAARTARHLEVKLIPERDRINLEVVRYYLDAVIRNRRKGTLRITHPVIRLKKAGQVLKTINLDGYGLNIRPESTLRLSDAEEDGGLGGRLVLQMPTAQILALFPELLAAITGQGPEFRIEVEVQMQVKAPGLPRFTHTEVIPLVINRPN